MKNLTPAERAALLGSVAVKIASVIHEECYQLAEDGLGPQDMPNAGISAVTLIMITLSKPPYNFPPDFINKLSRFACKGLIQSLEINGIDTGHFTPTDTEEEKKQRGMEQHGEDGQVKPFKGH